MKDYYQILGVRKNANTEDIKRAYRRKALSVHPDVNKGADAGENFISINEAYETLVNPGKRRSYDYKMETGIPYMDSKPGAPVNRDKRYGTADRYRDGRKPPPRPAPKPKPRYEVLFERGAFIFVAGIILLSVVLALRDMILYSSDVKHNIAGAAVAILMTVLLYYGWKKYIRELLGFKSKTQKDEEAGR